MGTHRNGDNLPPEGDRWPEDRSPLPELPRLPDGVVVPDDVSALAEEAEQVRAELARQQRDRPWFGGDGSGRPEPSTRLPLFIMVAAVAITVVSLVAMLVSSPGSRPPTDGAEPVPEVVLTDDAGRAVNVASLTPAAIMFVDGCDCAALVAATAAAAPDGVSVVVVDRTVPELPPGVSAESGHLVLLSDPEAELWTALDLGSPPVNVAAVVLADQDGITTTAAALNSIESYADALARLGG